MRKTVKKRQGSRPLRKPPRRKAPEPRVCNDRELIFIDEYLKDFNATQAAIRAGFTDKPTSAKSIGSRILNEPHVIIELARRREQLMEKHGVSLDLVLEEVRRIAFANLGAVANWTANEVTLIPKEQLTEAAIATIAEIEATEDPGEFGTKRRVRVKLHPKLPALIALLERLEPSAAERARGLTGSGGVQLIIDGGPTGLEVPNVTVRVGGGRARAS
jgi:phage terminase small subunit